MREFTVALPQRNTHVLFFPRIAENILMVEESSALLVFDTNTENLFPDKPFPHYTIPAGEQFKCWDTIRDLSAWALEQGAGRDITFIAVGGGVVCDMTAFLASVFMRGTGLVLVPSTLLAMVDAALGGKTGIDFEGYKNILGTFFPAREVRVFPRLLESLPEREYLGGLAEAIKHGLLMDNDLFGLLKNQRKAVLRRDPETINEVIYRSVQVKKWFIEEDPYENDIRGHLNLGHTFAHALETHGGFSKWTHGEAVAWGIDKAMKAGVMIGLTDPGYAEEVHQLLREYGFGLDIEVKDPEALIMAMKNDKKKKSGKVRFILQKRQGDTRYADLPGEILRRVIV